MYKAVTAAETRANLHADVREQQNVKFQVRNRLNSVTGHCIMDIEIIFIAFVLQAYL
jgi:hypothetical protein